MLGYALIVLVGALYTAEARQLKQDTYVSWKGQQPSGLYSLTSNYAEAGAASTSKGIRYNGGKVIMAGDGVPGPTSSSITGSGPHSSTRSGNTPGEVNTNLGREAMAATYEGARAVAGSGVSHMLGDDDGQAASSTTNMFRPRMAKNRGSVAFTDNPGTSAAVSGQGNGPVAMAWGNEVVSFARAHRDKEPFKGSRDGFSHH